MALQAEHSGIGYTAELVHALEKHPHKPRLLETSPLVAQLSCAANSAPGMPSKLKRAVRKLERSMGIDSSKCSKKSKVDTKALGEIQDWFVHGSAADGSLARGLGKALVTTTQAVDIINGGLKINALVSLTRRR